MASRARVIAILIGISRCAVGAATVDVDYNQVRDMPLGQSLLAELKIDIPGATHDYGSDLERLRLDWDGSNSPLFIALRGLPVPSMKDDLAKTGTAPVPTPRGDALPLPRDPRYAVLPLNEHEAVIATPIGLSGYAPTPWPEPTGAALAFAGVPKDINLEDFDDRVDTFTITLDKDGHLVGRINAKNRNAARSLMSYISNRLPLLNAAAAVGVEKAMFPKRMVDASEIRREGSTITITCDLAKDEALRKEAYDFLIHTLRRRMKHAS